MAGKSSTAFMSRPSVGMALEQRLDGVRSRIEQRFLDGGGILLSVLDVLNRLTSALDEFSKLLDDEMARSSLEKLGKTIRDVSALPGFEEGRQTQIAKVALYGKSLAVHIADMQETLRYLRTFATTAKITGSRIPEFSAFADEIVERVRDGADQINALSGTISSLDGILRLAASRGHHTLDEYRHSVPTLVERLTSNVTEFSKRRGELSKLAVEVNALTRKVQMKISTILSAMQIGDITRQRIEHCQTAIEMLHDFLDSPDGKAMDAEQREYAKAQVHRLVHTQLLELSADFDRDCTVVVNTINSFNSDIQSLLHLHNQMNGQDGNGAAGAMRVVETDISSARVVVSEIEKTAGEADRLSKNTIDTIQTLLTGVETIKQVQTDIHYMALNTNLRCGRLGEEGRAINVVTSELRVFAGNLHDTAECVITELQGLEVDARKLGGDTANTTSEGMLEARLTDAHAAIGGIAGHMEDHLKILQACGEDVGTKVLTSLSRLDFKTELGDVLADCTEEAGALLGNARNDPHGVENAIHDLGQKIGRIYTMVAERDIHARIFGDMVPASAGGATGNAESEEFDLDAALF
jgi:hypothetical protein